MQARTDISVGPSWTVDRDPIMTVITLRRMADRPFSRYTPQAVFVAHSLVSSFVAHD